jgi:Lar family restriction alleviation protein
MNSLMPCPFCACSRPTVEQIAVRVFAVVCNECGMSGPVMLARGFQDRELAQELWNRRPAA